MPKIHTLKSPLFITSHQVNNKYGERLYHMLPRGTVLYKDQSDTTNKRVMVYFNLAGVSFGLKDRNSDTPSQPDTLSKVTATNIQDVLKHAKLSKTDLFSIISNDENLDKLEKATLYRLYKIEPRLYSKQPQ